MQKKVHSKYDLLQFEQKRIKKDRGYDRFEMAPDFIHIAITRQNLL